MSLEQDLAIINRQEEVLCFDAFSEETAWQMGSRLREAALKRKVSVEIEIVLGSWSVFACAMPGTSPNNADWVRRKRNSVLHFHCSTYGLGRQLERDGDTLSAKYGLSASDYVAAGGGFPVRVRGTGVVGAIIVSGLPQREDHKLVVSVLAEYLNVSQDGIRLD